MYRESIRMFLEQFIGFNDDIQQRSHLLDALSSPPQNVVASELESYSSFDTEAAASAIKIPVMYVGSGPNFSDLTRFKEVCPQLITGQTVGSGHYYTLEVPMQINAMIERFIEVAVPA